MKKYLFSIGIAATITAPVIVSSSCIKKLPSFSSMSKMAASAVRELRELTAFFYNNEDQFPITVFTIKGAIKIYTTSTNLEEDIKDQERNIAFFANAETKTYFGEKFENILNEAKTEEEREKIRNIHSEFSEELSESNTIEEIIHVIQTNENKMQSVLSTEG